MWNKNAKRENGNYDLKKVFIGHQNETRKYLMV